MSGRPRYVLVFIYPEHPESPDWHEDYDCTLEQAEEIQDSGWLGECCIGIVVE